MPLAILDRVIVFDYGEVISRSPSERDRAELLAIAGADADAFWAAYWRHRDLLDHGRVDVREYWMRVAGDLGVEFSPTVVQQLWVADFRGWISVEPGTLEVLEDLRAGGTRLALLSNAGFDFGDPFRYSPMGAYFERVFTSAELGLVKPDPGIYRVVARELGIPPERMVFIDNKQDNVDGATGIGITGHRFTDADALRSFLEGLA